MSLFSLLIYRIISYIITCISTAVMTEWLAHSICNPEVSCSNPGRNGSYPFSVKPSKKQTKNTCTSVIHYTFIYII